MLWLNYVSCRLAGPRASPSVLAELAAANCPGGGGRRYQSSRHMHVASGVADFQRATRDRSPPPSPPPPHCRGVRGIEPRPSRFRARASPSFKPRPWGRGTAGCGASLSCVPWVYFAFAPNPKKGEIQINVGLRLAHKTVVIRVS